MSRISEADHMDQVGQRPVVDLHPYKTRLVAVSAMLLALICTACTGGDPGDAASKPTVSRIESSDTTLPAESGPGALDETAWIYLEGLDRDLLHGELWLHFFEGQTISTGSVGPIMTGTDGCNSFGSPYEVTGSSITLDRQNSIQTLIGCPGPRAELAAEYLEALFSVERFLLNDDVLTLDGQQAELRFARVPIIEKTAFVDSIWLIDSMVIDGVASSAIGEAGYIKFDTAGFSASSGCYRYAGTWSIVQPNKARVSNLNTTGVCDTERTVQDAVLRNMLNDQFAVAMVDQNSLLIVSGNTDEVLFRRSRSREIPPQPVNFNTNPGQWQVAPRLEADLVLVYVTPSETAPVVAALEPGTTLRAVGAETTLIQGVGWSEVSTTTGRQGWIRAEYLARTE